MSYKVGERIIYIGEVRVDGVLQDISTWAITGQAKKDSDSGELLGNFTLTRPGLGLFQLVLETAGFAPCQVFFDARVVKPDGQVVFTDTDKFPLLKSVTDNV